MDDEDTVLIVVLAALGGLAVVSLAIVGVGAVLLLAWPMVQRPGARSVAVERSPTAVTLALPVVAAPPETPTPTVAPTATAIPVPAVVVPPTPIVPPPLPSDTPIPTQTPLPTDTASPVFQSGGLGQPRTWWEEHFGPQIEIFGMPGYGDFNVLFMPGDRAGHIERQFDPAIPLESAQAMAASLLPIDAQFVERYSPEGRPEAVVDVYLSASLAQNYPDASEWEYYPPGQFIVLYKVFEPGVARLVVALGDNP